MPKYNVTEPLAWLQTTSIVLIITSSSGLTFWGALTSSKFEKQHFPMNDVSIIHRKLSRYHNFLNLLSGVYCNVQQMISPGQKMKRCNLKKT